MNYRRKANITLAVVFLFFLGMAVLEYFQPGRLGIRLLFFVSEAALVGGVADWFAVTAIFKKPLGWGYHTALIPRNRERVIEAVAAIVQKELLNMNIIRKKIEGISFSVKIISAVERAGGSEYLTEKALSYLRSFALKKDPSQLAERLAGFIRDEAKTWNLAPKLAGISEWVEKRGYVDKGLDLLAEELLVKAASEETREIIHEYLRELKREKTANSGMLFNLIVGFAEMSDGLNLEEAAAACQLELGRTLDGLKDPADPLRLKLKNIILRKTRELEKDAAYHSRLEQWKDDILADAVFRNFLETVVAEFLKAAAEPTASSAPNTLSHLLYPLIEKCWLSVRDNSELQVRVNAFLGDTICKMIQNEHDLIGSIVRETLNAYTDQDLNQFIEEKAGNDLQWIRINGSMIGGLVGFFLFLFLEFIYDPYIMPALLANIW